MRNPYLKVVTGEAPGTESPDTPTIPEITLISQDVFVTPDEIANYAITVPRDNVVYSYERWMKVYFDNADSTTISNLKFYVTGSIANGAYLRIGTAATYTMPVNYPRDVTATKTYGLTGSEVEIDPTNQTTWLPVQVYYDEANNIYYSDYIVVQLVVDGTQLNTLQIFTDVQFHFVYDEV